MERDWDQRARENARYYVETSQVDWTDEEFCRSGEATLAEQILNDMINICQGKDPDQMRVLEIGCGTGRVTRALAGLFGEVHGVDVSGEMVRLARQALADRPNAFVYQNNGIDLAVLGDLVFDFAFSSIVSQPGGDRELRARGLPRAAAGRLVQIPGAGRHAGGNLARGHLARSALLRRGNRGDGLALRF
jgi:SAM-dependent methyltransferase